MVFQNLLGRVKTCFGHNKVEILTIFISLYFVKGIPRNFYGHMRVLGKHYNFDSKVILQEAAEKSYDQLKMLKVKLCKCAVASLVNGLQKYFTSRFVTFGLFKNYP